MLNIRCLLPLRHFLSEDRLAGKQGEQAGRGVDRYGDRQAGRKMGRDVDIC